MSEPGWRVGNHYGIHVYEGDRPVATFHDPEDAARAVAAVNGLGDLDAPPRQSVPADDPGELDYDTLIHPWRWRRRRG